MINPGNGGFTVKALTVTSRFALCLVDRVAKLVLSLL